MDPQTPVVVGVAQITSRPSDDPATWTEPCTMMARALEQAAGDAAGTAGGRSGIVDRLDELTAIPSFVWKVPDPALAAAREAGVVPRRTRLAFDGGTTPQSVLFDAAVRIQRGELEAVGIVGAEAMRSRELARRQGVEVEWRQQAEGTGAAEVVEAVPDASSDHERSLRLFVPVRAYALMEHARRRAMGLTREEHRHQLGALQERLGRVAASNDLAALRTAPTAAEIVTVTPRNRMVASPYTKLLTSNNKVDQAAAVLVCSYRAARAAGVPEDRMVFPRRGAKAREQWRLSERRELGQSIAMRAIAAQLFTAGSPGVDDLAYLDLYSCFPVAVEMAGDALDFDLWGDERPPTVTGGLTFFGGPGNDYVTHSIATMIARLRSDPGSVGLVTALGWYASTHSWATYSTSPPSGGVEYVDVQEVVDEVPLRIADEAYVGAGVVESYSVHYGRDGDPTGAVVAVRTPAGSRRLVGVADPAAAGQLDEVDPLDARVEVRENGLTLG